MIFAQQSGFICVDKKSKMASILAWDPSGKMTIWFFLRYFKLGWTQTVHALSLDGVFQIFLFLVHQDRSRWTIAITWHPSSVNFSHFKLLLWNHWANWNQTYQECSLDSPLQSFCFSFQSDIQHGCQCQ